MAYSREYYLKMRSDPERWERRKLQVRQATAERGRRTAFHKGGKAGAEKPKRKMPEPNAVPGIPLSRLMAGR